MRQNQDYGIIYRKEDFVGGAPISRGTPTHPHRRRRGVLLYALAFSINNHARSNKTVGARRAVLLRVPTFHICIVEIGSMQV